MKRIIALFLTLMMVASVAAASVVTVSYASDDPSENYTVQAAPFEDSDISMWFQHANVKVHQEDTTSTGRNTYSIYMARNEYQGAQVTLYSENETKSNISANVTRFTAMNGSGATLSADLYYEFYIGCYGLDTTDVLGVNNASDSFIREGLIPDAMAKISDINNRTGKFTLTAGKTQTLYIKVKSELTTPTGWYSGQFNVTDSNGRKIKTATVYAYVWNFEIPEANHYQTAFYISYGNRGETIYKNAYDYLLDNRICGMNVPGDLNADNEYVTNPRVTSFRVSDKVSYIGLFDGSSCGAEQVSATYQSLSAMDDWENIKEKVYFYVADEPRSQQQKDYGGVPGNPTVAQLPGFYNRVANCWEDPYVLVAIDENHPYPAGYSKNVAYDSATGTYLTADDGSGRFDGYADAIQGMMNDDSVSLWCCKSDMFTPHDVILSTGYDGRTRTTKVKNMNGIISGFDCTNANALYFDWDSIYGPFASRFSTYQTQKAAEGKNVKLWIYECGKGPDYTYCNHLIENTGLQTELLYWQSMQIGATGYLYYGANLWDEHSSTCTAVGSSNAYDGTTVSDKWQVNRYVPGGAPGTYAYGNGNIYYGKDMKTYLSVAYTNQPLGTIRVENIRDGIEDYEMLYMYREGYGEAAMQDFITKVSNNVVSYLSMPGFDRSEYSNTMTDEDVFAAVRIELGNAVEEVAVHEHTWNDGLVIKPATCSEEGSITYTCITCGDTKTEAIEKLPHTWDEGVVTTPATYTTEGIRTYTCTVCQETSEVSFGVLPVKVGDVDGDGNVGMKDISSLKAYIAGTLTVSDIIATNSDIDGNEVINMMDISAIKVMIAG
ncbi:MAG: DUF4091 domain-containing protein [Clostridia bacterium]|nr:DUF4091 domain-containing protein [Clostridia bacterium]